MELRVNLDKRELKAHGTYEFRLNEDGSDYDWDNAYNTQTDEQIPLYPEDEAGQAKHDAFQSDNECYTIEDVEGNTVTNPQGILYMTANSASGSKFYELIASQQDYVAERSQNWLPSYSVINLTADTFSIDTYQITDAGKVEKIDSTFSIKKTDEQAAAVTVDGTAKEVATASVSGETYYRLRDLATAVNGTAAQFNVEWKNGVIVITGEKYDTAALAPAAEATGVKETLTIQVDGKTVTTSAADVNGNYYVPASLLSTLGIQSTVSGDTLAITTK